MMKQAYDPQELQLLIEKLDSYNFTDEVGHPLKNCTEYIALVDFIENITTASLDAGRYSMNSGNTLNFDIT